MDNDIQKRIVKIANAAAKGIYGKDDIILLMLLSSIANESAFLLGPPGTAKSLLARRVAMCFDGIDDNEYFEYLMNEFTTPDEICGPVSLKMLEKDVYHRLTDNYLPKAKIAFLDEIWKSGPAILNTLLTMVNEKLYHNGSVTEKIPLVSLFAASNELPNKARGLDALWDRFIVRLFVPPVDKKSEFHLLIQSEDEIDCVIAQRLDLAEIKGWQDEIKAVKISSKAIVVIDKIRQEIELKNMEGEREGDEKFYVSDRRWKKIVHILKTSAFLNNRDEVLPLDCILIEYCIWNTAGQIKEAREIIKSALEGNLSTDCFAVKGYSKYLKQLKGLQEKADSLKEQCLSPSISAKNQNQTTSNQTLNPPPANSLVIKTIDEVLNEIKVEEYHIKSSSYKDNFCPVQDENGEIVYISLNFVKIIFENFIARAGYLCIPNPMGISANIYSHQGERYCESIYISSSYRIYQPDKKGELIEKDIISVRSGININISFRPLDFVKGCNSDANYSFALSTKKSLSRAVRFTPIKKNVKLVNGKICNVDSASSQKIREEVDEIKAKLNNLKEDVNNSKKKNEISCNKILSDVKNTNIFISHKDTELINDLLKNNNNEYQSFISKAEELLHDIDSIEDILADVSLEDGDSKSTKSGRFVNLEF